jgi:hypothetical protein
LLAVALQVFRLALGIAACMPVPFGHLRHSADDEAWLAAAAAEGGGGGRRGHTPPKPARRAEQDKHVVAARKQAVGYVRSVVEFLMQEPAVRGTLSSGYLVTLLWAASRVGVSAPAFAAAVAQQICGDVHRLDARMLVHLAWGLAVQQVSWLVAGSRATVAPRTALPPPCRPAPWRP